MAKGIVKNPRMDNHPILKNEIPHVVNPVVGVEAMKAKGEFIEGFYVTNSKTRSFVYKNGNDRIVAYSDKGLMSMTDEKVFKSWNWVLEDPNGFNECHVVVNGATTAVLFNYYHAKLMYDALVTDFKENVPVPTAKQVKWERKLQLYVSGWGHTRKHKLDKDDKGIIGVTLQPLHLV